MSAGVDVRTAGAEDLAVVAELTAVARTDAPYGMPVDGANTDVLLTHLSVYLAAGGTILVAETEGRTVGFLLARTVGPHLFADEPALLVDTLYVHPRSRRRGVGHTLLARAAALAEEAGAAHVYGTPPAGDRGMQRFLARLGFAPAAGHRVVATATLQRRLTSDGAPRPRRELRVRGRREATRATIEDVIARRRRAREAGLPSGPVDLRDFQERHRARQVRGGDATPSAS
ncbi:GNAT family N-acetyltransferase [Puerhibacterium puerhi]|uniref:GNAT family N-acetyltransferase n=1 Tax=Puerhibacterium puerhi TaxID=2692623 RepID=UPI0013569C81|nr:GNAT family N-acetyltransferase [Puerhibacterium puerhi]